MKKSIETYQQLEYREKRILQLKCLVEEETSRTNLSILISKDSIKANDGKVFKIKDLDATMLTLKEKNYLTKI